MFEQKQAKNGAWYFYALAPNGSRRRISRAEYQNQQQKKEEVFLHKQAASRMTPMKRLELRSFLYENCFKSDFSSASQIALPGTVYWLASSKGEVKSMLSFEPSTGMVYNVCTGLSEHRKGYARFLLNHLAKSEKDRQLRLHVWADNEPAISLYRSLGYQVSERRETAGRPYLVMAKR